jgi:hypothetical protein
VLRCRIIRIPALRPKYGSLPRKNARKLLELRKLRAFDMSEVVGTRTRDLRIKSPLLYQLSYNPKSLYVNKLCLFSLVVS